MDPRFLGTWLVVTTDEKAYTWARSLPPGSSFSLVGNGAEKASFKPLSGTSKPFDRQIDDITHDPHNADDPYKKGQKLSGALRMQILEVTGDLFIHVNVVQFQGRERRVVTISGKHQHLLARIRELFSGQRIVKHGGVHGVD